MTALILLSEWEKSQIEFWLPTQWDGYDVSSKGNVRSYWTRCYVKGTKGVVSVLSDEPHPL